jgi:phage gpG-like protein
MTTFFIEIVGDKVVEYNLRRMGRAAIRARPAMRKIAEMLLVIEGKIFEGQGRRGGGSWAQLTEEWLMKKIRMGLDPRINIATGALMKSMSEPEAPHQLLHIGDTRVLLGSSLPYAETAERHRPYSRLTQGDQIAMGLIVLEHITSKFYKP